MRLITASGQGYNDAVGICYLGLIRAEIWARNGDKDSVHAPFNYVDKVMVSLHASGSLVPWYESVLPTGLQNRSEQIRHDPFVINDSVPDDYTSLSACTIEPGTRLCWAPKAQ